MTDKVVAPVFALIDYAYAVLNANDPVTWDREKYGGLIPIVPLSEEPELSDYDGPRIVYDYSMTDTGTLYQRGRGTVSFAILDHNYRRLTRAMNILQESFGRLDESARDVNDWLERRKPVADFDVSFGFIRVPFAESGTPETEEGGRQVGVVGLAFDYFVEYDINTRPPA